jgi:hypothetical protein
MNNDKPSTKNLLNQIDKQEQSPSYKIDSHPEIIEDIDIWLKHLEDGNSRIGVRRFISNVLAVRHDWYPGRESLSNWLHARRGEIWQRVKP